MLYLVGAPRGTSFYLQELGAERSQSPCWDLLGLVRQDTCIELFKKIPGSLESDLILNRSWKTSPQHSFI